MSYLERYTGRSHARAAIGWDLAGRAFTLGAAALVADALIEGFTAVPNHPLSLDLGTSHIPSLAGHVSNWLPGSTLGVQHLGVEFADLLGAAALAGGAIGSFENSYQHSRRTYGYGPFTRLRR